MNQMRDKGKRIGLRLQVGLSCTLLAVALIVLNLAFYQDSVEDLVLDAYIEKGVIATSLATKQVDGEQVVKFLEQGYVDADFMETKDTLLRNIKKNFNIQYFYLFVPKGDHLVYVYSAYNEGDDDLSKVVLGQVDKYLDATLIQQVIESGDIERSLDVNFDDKYGALASVYAPVFDANGKVVAVFAADFSLTSVLAEIYKDIGKAAAYIGISVMLLIALYSYGVNRRLVVPLKHLTVSAQHFVVQCDDIALEKNLNIKPVQIAGNNELVDLSDAFYTMAMDIKTYIGNLRTVTAAKQAIETELNVAKNIQEMLLPHIFPPFTKEDHFSIYAMIEAAKSVGGDYYDFYMIDGNHVCFTIADVSGKGVPAALFMVIAKTIMKNQAMAKLCPDEILAGTNNQLNEDNEEGMFVTAFLGVLELSTGRLRYANAGHNPPLLRRKNGEFEFLPVENNIVLAIMTDMEFKLQETVLGEGDLLFLYTDGVTEAMNHRQEQYTEPRLLDCLNALAPENRNLVEILGSVRTSISEHADGAEQSDDITMMVVRLDEVKD